MFPRSSLHNSLKVTSTYEPVELSKRHAFHATDRVSHADMKPEIRDGKLLEILKTSVELE